MSKFRNQKIKTVLDIDGSSTESSIRVSAPYDLAGFIPTEELLKQEMA